MFFQHCGFNFFFEYSTMLPVNLFMKKCSLPVTLLFTQTTYYFQDLC